MMPVESKPEGRTLSKSWFDFLEGIVEVLFSEIPGLLCRLAAILFDGF